MPVSIRDVAAQAGVSLATVSRVLNSKSSAQIAPKTRARVEHAATALGYHPSAIGRALARRQTDTFGIVLPSTRESPLRDSYFSALMDGVLEAATESEMDVVVFTAHASWNDRAYLAKLRDGRCDGLLLFHQPGESEIIPALLDAESPCVLVGDWREDPRLTCVDVESYESARTVVGHLLGLGHRRIALLSTGEGLYYVPPRLIGYRQALSEYGLTADEALIHTDMAPWDPDGVVHRIQSLMSLPAGERPTAFWCTTDNIAAIVQAALSRQGFRVPEDVSVAGFNDDSNAWHQHPPLTTMRQPYVDMGAQAIRLLLERIADPQAPAQKLELPTQLVIRGSTGPAREEETPIFSVP